MVRKDAEVNDTIKYIQNLLKTVGVTINITDKNEYKNNWYSVRIEINEMWGIGTNGKGVTYENALASALGEFMERLESGFLLDRLFPVKRNFQRTDRYASYWNLFEKSSTVLDESVIDIKCGTNGLSAGNSYEECFVQGSCEIFERMVLKEIYFNPHLKEKISIIKKEFYKNSEVYKYVSEIEKKDIGAICLIVQLMERIR